MINKLLAVVTVNSGGGGPMPDQGGGITNPVLGNLGKQTGPGYFASAIPAAVGLAFIIGTLIFFAMLV